MAHVQGIVVNLVTGSERFDATDDKIYIGVVGTDGGREYPLDVAGFDDFEKGTNVTYALGTVWDGDAISDPAVKNPRFSSGGDANDPNLSSNRLDNVNQVYIRKAGTRKGDGDNGYAFVSVKVALYGTSPESRLFESWPTTGGLHLSNMTGLQIWLHETRTNDGPRVSVAQS
jgi:hypothetical protein